MNCPYCGSTNIPESGRCPICGATLEAQPVQPVQAVQNTYSQPVSEQSSYNQPVYNQQVQSGRFVSSEREVLPEAPQSCSSSPDADAKASGGLIALSIIIPLVGIIMGIVFMINGKKHVGKTYLIAALISTGVGIILTILGSCLGVSALFNAIANSFAVQLL